MWRRCSGVGPPTKQMIWNQEEAVMTDIARIVVSARAATRPMRQPAPVTPLAAAETQPQPSLPPDYRKIDEFARLIANKEVVPGVLVAVDNEGASLWQSFLAERAVEEKATEEAPAGALEAMFDDHDPRWVLSFFTWWRGII